MPECYLENLGIRDHGGINTSNVQITLVELPEATPGHLRLIPPVHFGNVVPLDVGDGILSHIPRKGHRQVVPAPKQLAGLSGTSLQQLLTLAFWSSKLLVAVSCGMCHRTLFTKSA